jgi:hypothetical protein
MNEWISAALAVVMALATVAGVVIAWIQLRGLRREQRLSRRPIISVEPTTVSRQGRARFLVRNVGEGPAFRCSVAFFLVDVETLPKIRNIVESSLTFRYRADLGALGRSATTFVEIEDTPDPPDAWNDPRPDDAAGYAWVSHCTDVYGDERRDEGYGWIPMSSIVKFDR